MVQGLIAGATSYETQTFEEIKQDVEYWSKYTNQVMEILKTNYDSVIQTAIWGKANYDFKAVIESSIRSINTFKKDFDLVVGKLNTMSVTQREVNLLRNIGNVAIDYNKRYGEAYNKDTMNWHLYGNPDFEKISTLYSEGRDYFATLQDAQNAAGRLEDYVEDSNMVNVQNSIINTGLVSGNVTQQGGQVGTTNSSLTNNNEQSFDYEKILNILNTIKNTTNSETFDTEFGEDAAKAKKVIDEAISAAQKKEKSNEIMSAIQTLKDIFSKVAVSVISTGILGLLNSINL